MTTCSVCAKEVEKLFRCTRCKSSSYAVCSQDCQRVDWKRHKREKCLVVKIVDGLPTDECPCNRCKKGLTDIGDDDVTEFFNELHLVRGVKGVCKIVDSQEVPLTKEELNSIAYPYQRFTHLGQMSIMSIPKPKTFYSPNEKGFTVAQLADALTKAEKGNVHLHHSIGASGGGWYFEGFDRGKDPHTFIVHWGGNMRSSRVGVGMGFNHINTRLKR